jgi:hypothetical protein
MERLQRRKKSKPYRREAVPVVEGVMWTLMVVQTRN